MTYISPHSFGFALQPILFRVAPLYPEEAILETWFTTTRRIEIRR